MAKGLLGKKVGMTQIFDEKENMVPVTVIEAGPCVVTEKRTEEKDGYQAVQLGFEDIKENKLNKPKMGQFNKYELKPKKYLVEFRDFASDLEIGDEITVDIFEEGEIIKVKGFLVISRDGTKKSGPKHMDLTFIELLVQLELWMPLAYLRDKRCRVEWEMKKQLFIT